MAALEDGMVNRSPGKTSLTPLYERIEELELQVQTLESKTKVSIGPDLSDIESALTRGLQKEQKNR